MCASTLCVSRNDDAQLIPTNNDNNKKHYKQELKDRKRPKSANALHLPREIQFKKQQLWAFPRDERSRSFTAKRLKNKAHSKALDFSTKAKEPANEEDAPFQFSTRKASDSALYVPSVGRRGPDQLEVD
ncbi:hypothetical protein WN51_07769 [Melipona quadrifasciata]|uniref:Uncharacterized protein n=1 Tax=Melipona quadrifasciata TaxID=166423 RepID=A0A0M9A8Y4_9HYME|nr:hypothetical protein WN51_07769 [Melipona quadrifasciata]